MAESLDRPPVDAILQKVLEAVPFRLTVSDGVAAARRGLRELPRRPLHPDLRVEDHTEPIVELHRLLRMHRAFYRSGK